jgi:hypothetical protein
MSGAFNPAERLGLRRTSSGREYFIGRTLFFVPQPARFIRRHTLFIRTEDDRWRRDEEVHQNVLLDTARIPALLSEHEVLAQLGHSFGVEELPKGLVTLVGKKLLREA